MNARTFARIGARWVNRLDMLAAVNRHQLGVGRGSANTLAVGERHHAIGVTVNDQHRNPDPRR